ncbi:xylulokinase [Phormidium tenue FACHB-886]|nr:xylulokinase [Phormidium tenue FACHB-886]
MNEVAIGLDLGTSGVRVIAVNLQGKVVVQATRSYPLLSPQPGWTEQDPAAWVEASFAALSEVAQQLAGYTPIALGLSGQMHGMVALSADGTVVRPAILWNDQRTERAVVEIETIVPRPTLIQRTGNRAVTGFQLPKLIWLRREEPQAFAQTRTVLLPKDYLGYVLTGNRVTEPSDASGTGCLQLSTRQWDTEILQAVDLDPALFPQVIESTAIAGQLKPEIAARIGFPAGLPVVAGGGDNAAAAIGVGISSAHLQQGSISLGTSGVIFAPVEQPIPDPEGRVHLFCHVDGGYHLLGVTLAAGGSLRWYHDTFAPSSTYSELMNLAAQSPAGSQGVLFSPHLAGERTPYLDPEARGAWVNLALAHSQADLVRSLLEGVAFSLKLVQKVMAPLSSLDTLIATGGGAKSAVWLEILADVLEMTLVTPQAEEGAAYGAALLAMVGAGVYPKVDQGLKLLPDTAKSIQPNSNPVYAKRFAQFETLYEALKAVR